MVHKQAIQVQNANFDSNILKKIKTLSKKILFFWQGLALVIIIIIIFFFDKV